MRYLRAFFQLSTKDRFQFCSEIVSIFGLIAATVGSCLAGSWAHSVVFFSLCLIIVSLAEDRIQAVFGTQTVEQIHPLNRSKAFSDLTEEPKEWIFRGGSGRWFRSTAIPAVAKAATNESSIKAILLDPRDENICLAYANYRRKSKWYKDHTVDVRGIQAEVLATILTLMESQSSTRIKSQVGLTTIYSPTRYDANGSALIITTPNRKNYPLKIGGSHWLYAAFVDEVNGILKDGPSIIWPKSNDTIRIVDEHSARIFLEQTSIKTPTGDEPFLSNFAADGVDWARVTATLWGNADYKIDQTGG